MSELDSLKCLNCGHAMHGPVCSYCGQKEAKPIVTKRVANDIWDQFLDLDYRIIQSLKDLLLRPGLLINSYLDGKRIHYTNPFKLLFIIATAYFLVIQYFDIRVDPINQNDNGKAVAAFLNYLIFLFLIPTAYLFRIIFAKNRLNFAESYVSCCFIWTGYLFVAIFIAILSLPITKYFMIFRMVLGWLYLIYTSKQMFQLNLWSATWKSTLLYVCYLISTALFMGVIITLAHIFEYQPLMIKLR